MSRPDGDLPIWMRPAPGERKPAYTREKIVETALRIADEEGFEAVSMRRVATELGAGTMTLYHYVSTRDELTALMGDAIMGELLISPDELPDGWREGLAEIARRTLEVFSRHPWIVGELDQGEDGPGGPNGMRHFEQSLAVAARTGLDLDGQILVVTLVDDYVFGHAVRARGDEWAFGDDEESKRRADAVIAYLEAQLATGEFPTIQAIAGDDLREGFERFVGIAADESRFERGLQMLLDGVELEIQRQRGRS